VKYQKLSPRQNLALTWWNRPGFEGYDGIICDGSIRSGKTVAMTVGFVMWAMRSFEGQNFAVCGKTIESLRRNVTSNLSNWLAGVFSFKEHRSENKIVVTAAGRTNTFYLFGGKDESSAALIQGITLAGILLDEVALMPRSFVEQAVARCSVTGSKLWFNCNPEGPSHWFYLNWVCEAKKLNMLRLHFTMDDNLSLSPEVKARYESLYSGVFYDRFIRGLWVVAEGLIYTMFNKDFHVVPSTPRPYEKYYLSCDYGTINPTSIGLWGLAAGKWYRVREYYFDSRKEGRQRTDEEHYTALEALAGDLHISAVIVDPSAASFIEVIRRHGRYRVEKASNSVMDGIRDVATRLQCGDIFFCDCCTDCIREFGLYRWDEKATADRPIKENDHSMDDVRYFVHKVYAPELFSFK
jgi:PBSX family phage terminase large subunit